MHRPSDPGMDRILNKDGMAKISPSHPGYWLERDTSAELHRATINREASDRRSSSCNRAIRIHNELSGTLLCTPCDWQIEAWVVDDVVGIGANLEFD